MITLNTTPMVYALFMALVDVITFSLVRSVDVAKTRWFRWMILPTLFYAFQPWILLDALKYETLIVMNFMWDVISDILVTLTGYFYFGERIGVYKIIGVSLAFVSAIFMSIQENP
jgi:multidrug transporter EmrE-like cation transporter